MIHDFHILEKALALAPEPIELNEPLARPVLNEH